MKIFKKSLSIILCLAMIMSLFVGLNSITVSAGYESTTNWMKFLASGNGRAAGSSIFSTSSYDSTTKKTTAKPTKRQGYLYQDRIGNGTSYSLQYLTISSSSSAYHKTSSSDSSSRRVWTIRFKITELTSTNASVGFGYSTSETANNTASYIAASTPTISKSEWQKDKDQIYTLIANDIGVSGKSKLLARLLFDMQGTVEIQTIKCWAADDRTSGDKIVILNDGDYQEARLRTPSQTLPTSFNGKEDNFDWVDENGNPVTEYTDWMNVYLKEEVKDPYLCDFEDDSYKVQNNNTASRFTIETEEDGNKVLKRPAGGSNMYEWGFLIGNFTEKTPLEAGKTYKLTFKAKASTSATIDYTVYTARTYVSGNYQRDVLSVFDPSTGKTSSKLPSAGNKISVNKNWNEYTVYFTAEAFDYEGTTYTKPHFFIVNPVWNVDFYFDDLHITPCDNSVNFKLYDNKYTKPFVAENGAEISMPANPERENYIFEGWYADADFANEFTATTISGNTTAYAKWSEAVTELEKATLDAGVNDLGMKVTNANAYPVKFSLVTDGTATVTIFTASAADAADKSVVWQRSFANNGTVAALIEPAVINSGNNLYVSVDGGNVTELVIGGEGVPTARYVEGDINADNAFNLKDLVAIKKMAVGITAPTWLGDLDDDGYVATATEMATTRKALLGHSTVVTTIGDRTLVWNDEFDAGKLNTQNFKTLSSSGINQISYDSNDVVNFYNGNLNLKVQNIDGTNFKTPYRLSTIDKMTFNRGYLEIRAKINAVPGQWSAFWLSGEKFDTTVHHGEIDIVETNPSGSSFKPNTHSWDLEGNRLAQYGDKATKYVYSENNYNKTEYHTFGFEWNETEMKFYVDGVCYETIDIVALEKAAFDGDTIFTKSYPFEGLFEQFYALRIGHIIYNAQEYSTSLDSNGAMPEMNIDYVRLYQKAGEELKIGGELVAK